ncbi:TniQ family protein [Chromobacterium subtsugae]|uniref:TniQ family protein n=1 Tax=Chromobacterium subtsugae TaxID=251747 RepID=UPI000A5265F3|nr:TniQ family protein [Chromobacterium subtsugae]
MLRYQVTANQQLPNHRRTNQKLRLPIRVRPYPGESGISYLTRLAWANGYNSFNPLLNQLTSLTEQPARLRALLHLSQEEWQGLYLPWPKRVRPADAQAPDERDLAINYATTRWCPVCLRNEPHLDARWSIRLYCICPYHHNLLMDACPECGAVLSAGQVLSGHCQHCGQSLTEKVFEASEAIKMVQSTFQCSVERENQISLTITPQGWARLIQLVANIELRAQGQKTGQLAQLHRVSVLATVSHKLGSLLENWPDNFFPWLDKIKTSAPSSFSLRRSFGRLYHWLYMELDTPEFDFLREAFEIYLKQHWEGPITLRNHWQTGLHGQGNCITIQEACLKLRVTPAELKRLHAAGWLQANIVTSRGGRQFWSIPEAQLPLVKMELSEGLTLEATAKYLGFSKTRIRQLVATRVLLPQFTPGEHGASVWRFALDSMRVLVTRCQIRGITPSPTQPTITLSNALKTMRIDGPCFTALLRAIMKREVLLVEGDPAASKLGHILLDKRTLDNWLSAYRIDHAGLLTIPEAAKQLGIKEQVAYHLVQRQLLASTLRNLTQLWITAETVADFERQYVALSTLAKEGNTSPRALLAKLTVQPVSGPTIDGCRQYFYRRTDLQT